MEEGIYCFTFAQYQFCEELSVFSNQLLIVREGMAHPKGFEPLTPRFVVWCSIQLSYGCMPRVLCFVKHSHKKFISY